MFHSVWLHCDQMVERPFWDPSLIWSFYSGWWCCNRFRAKLLIVWNRSLALWSAHSEHKLLIHAPGVFNVRSIAASQNKKMFPSLINNFLYISKNHVCFSALAGWRLTFNILMGTQYLKCFLIGHGWADPGHRHRLEVVWPRLFSLRGAGVSEC